MASVTGKLTVTATGTQPNTSVPGVNPTPFSTTQSLTTSFGASGTGADQVDSWSSFTLSVTTSGTTVDLTALAGVYGASVSMARVKRLVVKNRSTTAGQTVTLAPGASNGWTALLGAGSTLVLHPSTATPNDAGAVFVAPGATAWAVSGTSKTLTFTAASGTISVDVDIMGASA